MAVNQVKPGRLADFGAARGAFITAMKKVAGVGPDAAFQSFFTMPGENEPEVFLDALSQQPGFVAEYQWVSALDPNIVVGMTVYESIDAFAAIAQNQEFVGQMMPFISDYPPFTGYIHVDARR